MPITDGYSIHGRREKNFAGLVQGQWQSKSIGHCYGWSLLQQPWREQTTELGRHSHVYMSNHEDLDAASISEVINMALSDHVSFDQIRATHGLSQDQVKALMRQNLSPGSYRSWRRRVRRFL